MPMWLTCVVLPEMKGKTHGVPSSTLPMELVHHCTAPTRSSTQAAANNLSRKGRTTCWHRPCGEMIGMGAREGPERAKGELD